MPKQKPLAARCVAPGLSQSRRGDQAMGFFQKLFGKTPEINVSTAKIDEQVYLMNYRDHYASILGEHSDPRRLAELFLFRGWTAQFGYRIFSSNPTASAKL
jgi:hypothetical protein